MTYGEKRCSNCGEIIHIKGASYCPYCGGYLLSKKAFCLKTLDKILKADCFPKDKKGEFIYGIGFCIDYIKEIIEEEK